MVVWMSFLDWFVYFGICVGSAFIAAPVFAEIVWRQGPGRFWSKPTFLVALVWLLQWGFIAASARVIFS